MCKELRGPESDAGLPPRVRRASHQIRALVRGSFVCDALGSLCGRVKRLLHWGRHASVAALATGSSVCGGLLGLFLPRGRHASVAALATWRSFWDGLRGLFLPRGRHTSVAALATGSRCALGGALADCTILRIVETG